MIAQRHPERGREVVEMAREADLAVRLRSRTELPDDDTAIYVVDTMGELGLVYRLAPIVFVGGSLATHGGQNPIEPAKLGAAILHGPHVWNFAEIYSALDSTHGAAQVTDVGKLAVRVGAWLKDAGERAAAIAAARATVTSLGGALTRTHEHTATVRFDHHVGESVANRCRCLELCRCPHSLSNRVCRGP
jgi:3-deoxy-D-manno-octulosonic-acid transferase